MQDRQLSENFKLSEFNYVEPDPRLLHILQYLRDRIGEPIVVTDSARTFSEHVAVYQKLERKGKLKTRGNGLGDKALIDCIPMDSRHLPSYSTPYLRACDISVRSLGVWNGDSLASLVKLYTHTREYFAFLEALPEAQQSSHVGIGIGLNFIHIDIDRERETVWKYEY